MAAAISKCFFIGLSLLEWLKSWVDGRQKQGFAGIAAYMDVDLSG
jgi:hypothetical protein